MIKQSDHYIQVTNRLKDDTKLNEIALSYQNNLLAWREEINTISGYIDAMILEGHIEKVELDAYSHDRVEFSIEMLLGHRVYITVGHANNYYTRKFMYDNTIGDLSITYHTDDIVEVLDLLKYYNYIHVKYADDSEIAATWIHTQKLYEAQQELKNVQS